MDFNKLRSLIEVVEAGSITAAARRLYRTQQAVSWQITTLEAELGLTLLHRQGRRVQLTEAGRTLYTEAKEGLARVESAVAGLRAAHASLKGTLRLGVWLEQAVAAIPEVIRGFVEIHPGARIELRLGTDAELEAMLLADQIDAGFFVFVRNGAAIETTPVFRRNLMLVGSPELLAEHPPITSIEDTLSLPVVDYGEQHASHVAWVRKHAPALAGRARRRPPRVVADNDLVLRALALQGLGLAILPEEIITSDLAAGRLTPVLPDHTGLEAVIDLGLVRGRTPGALLAAFSAFVRPRAAGLLEGPP